MGSSTQKRKFLFLFVSMPNARILVVNLWACTCSPFLVQILNLECTLCIFYNDQETQSFAVRAVNAESHVMKNRATTSYKYKEKQGSSKNPEFEKVRLVLKSRQTNTSQIRRQRQLTQLQVTGTKSITHIHCCTEISRSQTFRLLLVKMLL